VLSRKLHVPEEDLRKRDPSAAALDSLSLVEVAMEIAESVEASGIVDGFGTDG
jgi:hypothetical protein